MDRELSKIPAVEKMILILTLDLFLAENIPTHC